MFKEGENGIVQEYFCSDHIEFKIRNDYIDSELKVCIERIKILKFALSYLPIRLQAGGDDEEDVVDLQINACYNERDLDWLNEHSCLLQYMNLNLFNEFERVECEECWRLQELTIAVVVESVNRKLATA